MVNTTPAQPGNPWSAPGEWVRGNLHCHSTGSDGRLSPQEAVDRYAARGDGFLGISDHDVVTSTAFLDARGLCLLPAAEVSAPGGELGTTYHLLAIGARSLPPPRTPAPEATAFLRAQGSLVFVAHPHWSGLTVTDILRLPDVTGIEVYNGATVLESCKGEAPAHWDEAWARGNRLWGIAGDDMHWGSLDLGVAWLHARTPSATPEGLLDALAAGHFYASTGPEMHEVRVSANEVVVRCSPCLAIYCLSFGPRNQFAFDRESVRAGRPPQPITEATFRLTGREPYVRIQVVDAHRRSAWSNPIVRQ